MKAILLTMLSNIYFSVVFAQYQGPIQPITSGFGSNGNNIVTVTNLVNDHFPAKSISVFYPQNSSQATPTIFFSHGYGAIDTLYYIETIHHLVSRGYTVVYVPYSSIVTNEERYATLYDGFVKAARTLTSVIDTTRVGFYGHSFGGGATPSISYRLFTENLWGSNGRFIYCDAPYYTYQLTASELSNFPTDCNMLTLLFDDDTINDLRIGMGIFENISIPDSIKDCITVFTDTIGAYIYQGDHSVAPQNTNNSEFDALDYHVTFRLLDALAEYSFTKNPIAKEVALGNGSGAQTSMPSGLSPLFVTDDPMSNYLESKYSNPCGSVKNPFSQYCNIVSGIDEGNYLKDIKVYPNPTKDIINIVIGEPYKTLDLIIYDNNGKQLLQDQNVTKIDISQLAPGVYLFRIVLDNLHYINKKIIKTTNVSR